MTKVIIQLGSSLQNSQNYILGDVFVYNFSMLEKAHSIDRYVFPNHIFTVTDIDRTTFKLTLIF